MPRTVLNGPPPPKSVTRGHAATLAVLMLVVGLSSGFFLGQKYVERRLVNAAQVVQSELKEMFGELGDSVSAWWDTTAYGAATISKVITNRDSIRDSL